MASPNDAAIRQQIYLEGVKNYEASRGNEVAGAFIAAVMYRIDRVDVSALYEMTKKAFNSFLSLTRRNLLTIAKDYRSKTERWLRNVAKIDYIVTKAIYSDIAAQSVTIPKTTVGALWARIKNERISGTGDLPLDAVSAYYSGVVAYSLQLIQKNYADKASVADLIRALKGTPTLNYRDGAASRYYRQFGALVETVIQHGSSALSQWLGRIVSDRYVWISVLDANTTDVCRGRNGHIYRYGHGPVPPAHWRCRSRTRPYLAEYPTVPRTFYGWLTTQPKNFLADVLGAKTARSLIAGKIPAEAIPKYENVLRISPEEYKDKISLIMA